MRKICLVAILILALLSFPVSAKDDVAPTSGWRSIGHIKEIYRLIYSETENKVDIQFYFKPGGESGEGHVLFCHYKGRGSEAIETAKLIEKDFDSLVFEVQGILHLRGRLIHNIGPKFGYSRVHAEINLLKAVGKSITAELQWVMISTFRPDTNYGGWGFAEVRLWPVGGQIITVMGAALPELPASFAVSNQRLELDTYGPCEGAGQIRRLYRGISKTGSTWNLCNKDTPKTWLSGGPFKVGTDATTIFWSGTFTDDDPQVFTGNANLAAYIEGRGESNWVMFAVISTEIGATKILEGARLKFDYIFQSWTN